MIQSVYLHKYVVNTLKCFGNLETVINNVLDLSSKGLIDVMDKPPAPNRDGAGRYNIDVRNQDYIDLCKTFSINSPRISLRRLLYWFVDNEVYNDFNWKPVTEYGKQDLDKLVKFCELSIKKIDSFSKIGLEPSKMEKLLSIQGAIKDFKESL